MRLNVGWTRAFMVTGCVVGLAWFGGTPSARADVCTGPGSSYEASGLPPPALLAAAPILVQRRWSLLQLPWFAFAVSGGQETWSNGAYAWFRYATLWGARDGVSRWVVPVESCLPGQNGVPYDLEDCVLVLVALALVQDNCLEPSQIAAGAPASATINGNRWLVSGFAPRGAESVAVAFQHGTVTFPVAGGVYGGEAPLNLGKPGPVTAQASVARRQLASVVLVDETGLTPQPRHLTLRLRGPAQTLRRRLSIDATMLGIAVKAHRSHDLVLYLPSRENRALAHRVAFALHANGIAPQTGGALTAFGSIARVVVLVGKHA